MGDDRHWLGPPPAWVKHEMMLSASGGRRPGAGQPAAEAGGCVAW